MFYKREKGQKKWRLYECNFLGIFCTREKLYSSKELKLIDEELITTYNTEDNYEKKVYIREFVFVFCNCYIFKMEETPGAYIAVKVSEVDPDEKQKLENEREKLEVLVPFINLVKHSKSELLIKLFKTAEPWEIMSDEQKLYYELNKNEEEI